MDKITQLRQLAALTESHLQIAIRHWQVLPHTSFSRQPAASSWSANHCLQHLNSYGRYYLPLLQSALAKARPEPAGAGFRTGWLGGWFTGMMQVDAGTGKPGKVMKSPANHHPQTILPSFEVISEFIDQQEHLLQLLAKAEQVSIAHPRIPISFAPLLKLKPGDVFGFLIAHNERHVQQAQRALAATTSKHAVTTY